MGSQVGPTRCIYIIKCVRILFVLANSWVGQNSRPIELYFFIILEWIVVVSLKELKQS